MAGNEQTDCRHEAGIFIGRESKSERRLYCLRCDGLPKVHYRKYVNLGATYLGMQIHVTRDELDSMHSTPGHKVRHRWDEIDRQLQPDYPRNF